MTSAALIAVDTSVAVPLLSTLHRQHEAVAMWASGKKLALSGHALAETYSALTRLPGGSRVAPTDATDLIDANFEQVLTPAPRTTTEIHRLCAELNIAGGPVYDALVAFAARDNGATLATRDARARGIYSLVGVTTTFVAP
ncbi:PIN domain-containing protein [Tsukamurella pseudospumae]|uniref:Ribonuclease VapC n=1 Tax=Tsukamurella pseudospumae TaxID=239498 RepID=A0A138A3Y5_9ACTN|nr:PIN domain-containing protein [Tsukamurella pseudospumae]KXO96292.1 ribonuclease [Tsukamurella pseudospumae]KXP05144.1 ribonuclease [Tsukamurella pseudospumae]